jgi:beta-glucosidase/6-phospho-beta-glucosidase/beta-galactosidase
LNHQFGWLIHPIFSKKGGYPETMVELFDSYSFTENIPSRLPAMSDEVKKRIRGTADFLGINYYSSRVIGPLPFDLQYKDFKYTFDVSRTWERGSAEWFYIVPNGLYDLLNWISEKFDYPKIIITENGFSDKGGVDDVERVEYIKDHIYQTLRSIKNGCNVTAYTVWSLIDSFEWTDGYTQKFGIYSIDMMSREKERIPKKSAKFFESLSKNRRFTLTSK